MTLIELLDGLKDNPKVKDDIYRIEVKGIKNEVSYGNGIQSKLRKRIPESVLQMDVVGYISRDDSLIIRVDDIHV